VPYHGGQVLALLPRTASGACPCTPGNGERDPFGNPIGNNVLATTTALSDFNGSLPVVCVVRVEISLNVLYDVNRDGFVSVADEVQIQTSPFFKTINATPCGLSCGVDDVNSDGVVDNLDVLAITQAFATLPVDVRCGALQAQSFSCPSVFPSPLVTATDISLDEMYLFDSDGTLTKKRGRTGDVAWTEHLLDRVSSMDASLEERVHQHVEERVQQEQHQLEERVQQEQQQLEERVHQHVEERVQQRLKEEMQQEQQQLEERVQQRLEQRWKQQLEHLRGLMDSNRQQRDVSPATTSNSHWMIGFVVLPIAALALGVVVFLVRRAHRGF